MVVIPPTPFPYLLVLSLLHVRTTLTGRILTITVSFISRHIICIAGGQPCLVIKQDTNIDT